MMIRIFISSVQKELAAERRAIKDFIRNDPLLGRFIGDVFLFEDIPACDRKPDDIYLGEVEERDIYLAMLGNRYGSKNAEGKSPTELEFDHATRTHRERLVFVRGMMTYPATRRWQNLSARRPAMSPAADLRTSQAWSAKSMPAWWNPWKNGAPS
jgi:hypothetical protein